MGSERKWFIGVTAGEETASQVWEFREWMGARFGCRSGFRTAPHITLVPPFAPKGPSSPERTGPAWADARSLEADLAAELDRFSRSREAFIARLSGFDAFADRTLFIAVEENPHWHLFHSALYQHLSRTLPGLVRPEKSPFHPHLTIANRDIPPGAMEEALAHFRLAPLEVAFPVDHLSLFCLESGLWREMGRWDFTAK